MRGVCRCIEEGVWPRGINAGMPEERCFVGAQMTHLTGRVGVNMAGMENSVCQNSSAGEHGIFRGTNYNLSLVEPKCRGGRA